MLEEQTQVQETQQIQAPKESIENKTFGIFEEEKKEESKPVEPKPVEPVLEEQKTEEKGKVNRAFDELNRRSRELLVKEQSLKQKEAELEQYNTLKERAKQDPHAILNELGIPFDNLLDQYIEGKHAPKKAPLPEVEELKKELEGTKKLILDYQNKQFELSQQERIKSVISELASECEIVAEHANQDSNIINEIFKAGIEEYRVTNKIPDWADIVKRAESVLEESFFNAINRAAQLKKVKSRYNILAAQEAGKESQKQESKPQSVSTQTLTNKMVSESPVERKTPITEEDRIKAFIETMRKDGWKSEE